MIDILTSDAPGLTHPPDPPAGEPVQDEESGQLEFRLTGSQRYLLWFHWVGLVWVSHFLLACQQMTVAGAVVTYYFTRDKARLPATPILSSVLRLLRYHLGTVAKGSFIITLVQVPRLLLLYLHNQLRGRVGGGAGGRVSLWSKVSLINSLSSRRIAALAAC